MDSISIFIRGFQRKHEALQKDCNKLKKLISKMGKEITNKSGSGDKMVPSAADWKECQRIKASLEAAQRGFKLITLISGVARVVGRDFMLVMIQSSHRFGLAALSPNLFESSLAGWAPVLGFAAPTLGPFGLATRPLRAHPSYWTQSYKADI